MASSTVLDLLAAHLLVAWIEKESRPLTMLGDKSKRPDPEVAYQEAGIVLVRNSREALPLGQHLAGTAASTGACDTAPDEGITPEDHSDEGPHVPGL